MASDPYHISLSEFDVESECLGSGAYSQIVLAHHRRDNKPYALKVVDKDKAVRHNNVKYFLNERRVMLMCNHPRIVKLKWTTKDERHIYFIYEIAPNGELWESLRGFPKYIPSPALRRVWMSQIVAAVEYIHMVHNIAHRDLKPENVLIGESFDLLLCDFGTAKVMTKAVLDGEHQNYLNAVADATKRVDQIELMRKATGLGPQINGADVITAEENRRRSILYQASRSQSFTGTPHYMAPETIKSRGTRGTAADLWALGVILFQFETGQLPFQHQSQYAVMNEVVKLRYNLDLVLDDDARDLIRQLFKVDPRKRLGVVGNDGEFGQHPRKQPALDQTSHVTTESNDKDMASEANKASNSGKDKNSDDGNGGDDDDDDDGPEHSDDGEISDEEDEMLTNEIDPLTKKRRPKLLSETSVSSTQVGWDAIKAHPYFTKFFKQQPPQQQPREGDDQSLFFNCNLTPALHQEAKIARDLCFNFIKFFDENGNEALHPKQQLQADLKKQEEEAIAKLEDELSAAFPSTGVQLIEVEVDEQEDEEEENKCD